MKPQEIQTIFIDCDGVLYDDDLLTYEEIVNAGRQSGEALGIDWKYYQSVHDELKKQGFYGFYNTVLELCGRQSVSFKKLIRNMADILDYSRLKPDPELLKLLQGVSKKKKVYILTNNTRPHLEKVFNRLFGCTVEQSEVAAITAEDTLENGYFHTKRMKGVFSQWCQKLKTPASRTLMLDDSENVIEAAQTAGLQTIKIKNGDMTHQILQGFISDNLEELFYKKACILRESLL